jgi:hypothetical protein
MIHGSSPLSYFLSQYFVDVLCYMIAYTIIWGFMISVGLPLPLEGWYVGGAWALADPLFQYCLCYYFVKIKGGTPEGVLSKTIILNILAYICDQIGVTTALLVNTVTINKIFINLFCWVPTSNFVNSICLMMLRTEIALAF